METKMTSLLFRPNEMNETEKFFTVLAMTNNDPSEFSVPLEKAMRFLDLDQSSKQHIANILKGQFEEGFDFICKQTEASRPGRPAISYFLTIECFKQLCMIAKSDRGKEVRKYYLRLERMVHTDTSIDAIGTHKVLALLLAVELGKATHSQVYSMIEDRIMRKLTPEKIQLAFQEAKGYNQVDGGHDA